MSSDQFEQLELGQMLRGRYKGRAFFAVVSAQLPSNFTELTYSNGNKRIWSKSHIKKYYAKFASLDGKPFPSVRGSDLPRVGIRS